MIPRIFHRLHVQLKMPRFWRGFVALIYGALRRDAMRDRSLRCGMAREKFVNMFRKVPFKIGVELRSEAKQCAAMCQDTENGTTLFHLIAASVSARGSCLVAS